MPSCRRWSVATLSSLVAGDIATIADPPLSPGLMQAALGVVWFIPSFESTPDSGGVCSLRLPAKEVDFLKPPAGIEEVEVLWSWL